MLIVGRDAEAPCDVVQIRCVVQHLTLSLRASRMHALRRDDIVPELDRFLMGAYVTDVAGADNGAADEAAPGRAQRTREAFEQRGLEDHFVVDEQRAGWSETTTL